MKRTSKKIAAVAARAMSDPNTPASTRRLAASALSQRVPGRETGADMEELAGKVLGSDWRSDEARTFAASVVSQSDGMG